jgi:DNA-binding transcriptional LysR family regulator
METKKLIYLLRLYENKNITHTAKEMFITQSALTKMIQGWEEEFHCQLLIRSKKGVVFTSKGEQFVKLCRNLLRMENQFQENLESYGDAITGSLTVGISLNYMSHCFPTILQSFTKRNPYVHLSVTDAHSEKIYADLLNRKLDVAIVRGEYKWSDTKLHLSSEPLCLVSTFPLTEKTILSAPYIGHRTDTDTEFNIDRWFFERKKPAPEAAMWLSSISTCRDIVEKGNGWSILPKICLDGFRGNIRPMTFLDGTPFLRNTYALISHGQSELPHVRVFLEALKEYHQLR